ncbi:MAG: TonB family protein [Pseudomonadales bacterium]|nr:TonB family protein [Pseudomonadales bacterium]
MSEDESELVFRGLSYGHYQLEQFNQSLPFWQMYMELQQRNGIELERDDYAYLNGLYYEIEDFDSVLETTKEMILKFNNPTDWDNLREIYQQLDEEIPEPENAQALIGNIQSNGAPAANVQVVSNADAEYLPLVSIVPQYPTRAAQRGIEGWVLLSFTVDAEGTVVEDSITTVDAEPPNIFVRSAFRAASQFKFEPRTQNGEPVAVSEVEYLFRWSLDNDA